MHTVSLNPGKYVAAISGGVDSIVLLDVLTKLPSVEIIVAHIDHGIRADSHLDADLVRELAHQYGLAYEEIHLDLKGRNDEATARHARYEGLQSVYAEYAADGIVTAHHRDDVIETIIINLLRGTGWRGLGSLRGMDLYKRPFINVSKIDIVTYAIDHDLRWHEDITNDDMRYLRNYVRNGITPKLTREQIDELYKLYENQCKMGEMITAASTQLLRLASDGEHAMSRYWLIMTPDNVARELLRQKYGAMTSAQLSKLLNFARTARHGAKIELSKQHAFHVTSRRLIVGTP